MIENFLKDLTEAVRENTASIQALIASRDEAMAKIAEVEKPKRTRTAKAETADAAAATATAPAATTTATETPKAEAPKATTPPPANHADAIRDAMAAIVNKSDAEDYRAKVREFFKALCDHLGTKPAQVEADRAQEVLFYLGRFEAGLPVDFSADYDFAGPVDQGGTAASTGDDLDDLMG